MQDTTTATTVAGPSDLASTGVQVGRWTTGALLLLLLGAGVLGWAGRRNKGSSAHS